MRKSLPYCQFYHFDWSKLINISQRTKDFAYFVSIKEIKNLTIMSKHSKRDGRALSVILIVFIIFMDHCNHLSMDRICYVVNIKTITSNFTKINFETLPLKVVWYLGDSCTGVYAQAYTQQKGNENYSTCTVETNVLFKKVPRRGTLFHNPRLKER